MALLHCLQITTLKEFGGVVVDNAEASRITDALGATNQAIILQSHGLLTLGETIDSAVCRFIMLEEQCRVQLMADAAAVARGIKPLIIDEAAADFTAKILRTEQSMYFGASPYFQEVDAMYGDEYRK